MDAMQLSQPDPGLDCPVTDAKCGQLASGDDSVLALRERRQLSFA
jgi:hypothetical protein